MPAARRLTPRKSPSQQRSREMVEAILEAAARVLEQAGPAGFNTNAVAARAGVSVGSLYQYFPSKQALVAELSRRSAEALLSALETALTPSASLEADLRRFAHAAIAWQCERPALAKALDRMEEGLDLPTDAAGTGAQIQALIVRLLRPHSPEARDVALQMAASDGLALSRALIEAAIARGDAASPAFEDRLVGALLGYLRAVATF